MANRSWFPSQIKEQLTEAVKALAQKERSFKKTRDEKIIDLNKLQPGDHISFYKTDFYYAHHGIVCEARTDYLRVIHYFNTLEHARTALMRGSVYIAAIIESEWPVNLKSTSEDVYLHHYDNIPCFSNEETLERAFSQLGRRGYSLLGNNCEHWARWCRTGEHYSEQVYKFRGLVQEKSATLLILDPTALLVKDVAMVSVRTLGQFLSAVGSGVILTAVESISAFIDIRKKKNERKKGSLSDVALKKYVVRRITSASTTVVGGTTGTIVGTILIPVPILGATIGGFVGSIGGKLIGGVSGIALSKILEVYEKNKELKIKKMSAVPQLMKNLSPESEIIRGLIAVVLERDEEEKISNGIQEAMHSDSSKLYPSLEEFTRDNPNTTPEKCQAAARLTTTLFTDSNEFDYFILTPIPDDNAPEEFASSTDLLVLRWPTRTVKPWEVNGEQVLDIDDSNLNKN
ncbi:unnamed protein product [Rotaria sp. Silwood1]|nr:unnamed protein product [Rotaria sp. Silwood1]CAF3427505.1 unnamed protein product [Rotaria sp. Silwood1]CAF4795551.1 unnamed protein product [Rotaria sp. Silwood1]CAF4822807.1 unnamed protein product [Rotaria sp. Silwood1]